MAVKKLVFSQSVSSEGRLFSDVTSFSRVLAISAAGERQRRLVRRRRRASAGARGRFAARRIADPRQRLSPASADLALGRPRGGPH
jgi:hypothetical protein